MDRELIYKTEDETKSIYVSRNEGDVTVTIDWITGSYTTSVPETTARRYTTAEIYKLFVLAGNVFDGDIDAYTALLTNLRGNNEESADEQPA